MRSWLRVLLAGAALGAVVPAAQAATIPVTTTTDAFKIDGLCSLREAIVAASVDKSIDGIQVDLPGCVSGTAGEDTIQLGPGTYPIDTRGDGTPDDQNLGGDYDIVSGNRVRVVGVGMGATTIVGSNDRAFDVGPGSELVLSDLAIRGGAPVAPAQASLGQTSAPAQPGGAVRNRGALTVVRLAFSGNAASAGGAGASTSAGPGAPGGGGGAIWSGGTNSPSLVVTDSSFAGNAAGAGGHGGPSPSSSGRGGVGGGGGAIAVDAGSAVVVGSTFSNNRAGVGGGAGQALLEPDNQGGSGGSGGAIALGGGVTRVSSSTFAGNVAAAGGGSLDGPAGTAGEAGAVFDPGVTSNIDFSTFSGNNRGSGSTGANGVRGARISGSILVDPAPACSGPLGTSTPNVALPGDPSCATPRVDGDPRLSPLANNGGPTQTMLPGAGSVAINALAGVTCPATDQRGLPRPALGACDAGAVEIQPAEPGAAGAAGGGGGGKTLAPATTLRRISKVTLSRTAFRTKGKKPLGTTLGLRLNVASRIVLTVTKPASGRRSKGGCVAPTGKLAKARKCTRQVPLKGSLAKAGTAGLNTIAFSGKLRGKALVPGPYTFVLTLPKLGAAKPVVTTKGFRVIPSG